MSAISPKIFGHDMAMDVQGVFGIFMELEKQLMKSMNIFSPISQTMTMRRLVRSGVR